MVSLIELLLSLLMNYLDLFEFEESDDVEGTLAKLGKLRFSFYFVEQGTCLILLGCQNEIGDLELGAVD